MSRLGDAQKRFTRYIPRLLDEIHEQGYEVTVGDAYRDGRLFGVMGQAKGYGAPSSNHKQRLAIDLNLFKDGEYLTSSDDHRQFGAFWESLADECRWGGRFNDGNHYEVVI